MNLKTTDFEESLERIAAVPPELKDAYGRHCLSVPYLIMKNGLCQTIAFFDEKRGPDPEKRDTNMKAADLIYTHLEAIVGEKEKAGLLDHARTSSTVRMLLDTSRVLDAWQYQTRFAEAILGAKKSNRGS
jgi:CRISPR type III-B/RAMP module-associated protein Cmr5